MKSLFVTIIFILFSKNIYVNDLFQFNVFKKEECDYQYLKNQILKDLTEYEVTSSVSSKPSFIKETRNNIGYGSYNIMHDNSTLEIPIVADLIVEYPINKKWLQNSLDQKFRAVVIYDESYFKEIAEIKNCIINNFTCTTIDNIDMYKDNELLLVINRENNFFIMIYKYEEINPDKIKSIKGFLESNW